MLKKNKRKKLIISWQRLISGGSTCPRCGSTEKELGKAVPILRKALKPLGIAVSLEKSELTLDEFKKNPIQSNQILFNSKTLEELINAKTGHSLCCDQCGDNECRTIETEKGSFESVPAELIVKAGLIAASGL